MRINQIYDLLAPVYRRIVPQMLGCGILLYPERRGQTSGRYDADVVLLDAAGLLLFIVPGVIAFAMDILTGAIYLPPGEESKVIQRLGQVERIEIDPADPDPESISRVVEEETGLRIGRIQLHDDRTGCRDAEACLALYLSQPNFAGGLSYSRSASR